MHEERRVSKQQGGVWRALGLMSGTSLDGIDVAVIETDGERVLNRGFPATYPYSDAFREQLRQGLADAAGLKSRGARPSRLKLLERYLTELHGEAVANYLADHDITPESIDVIGFHGQTVLHRPEAGLTVQLGDGALLADLCGRPVVYDLRAADVAAGGQGAPLASVYHRAIASEIAQRPLVILNLGGVANVTWIGPDGTLIAFDTGPASAMIDDWCQAKAGLPFDAEGRLAARGRADQNIVQGWLDAPFFMSPPPKSLDRNAFDAAPIAGCAVEDGAATLTAFSAAAVARAIDHFPQRPELWIASGGGRRNPTLLGMIAERVAAPVLPAEDFGFDGDGVEAEAWAYLAVRSCLGLPITFPGTTGVRAPLTGGLLADVAD
jgi:anhydro-N-acetylmuramic acid kinase